MSRIFLLAVLSLSLNACSILSPIPSWELLKATGTAGSTLILSSPGEARNTVYHYHDPFKQVCIEFNPQAQVSDVLPALQSALHEHSIESRVYESLVASEKCRIWLKYNALIEWDTPPFADGYKAYVSSAALTLQTASGQVLSSSQYAVDGSFGRSKWASTRDKLGPVVTALVTGF